MSNQEKTDDFRELVSILRCLRDLPTGDTEESRRSAHEQAKVNAKRENVSGVVLPACEVGQVPRSGALLPWTVHFRDTDRFS
jgi:hypothetical protein